MSKLRALRWIAFGLLFLAPTLRAAWTFDDGSSFPLRLGATNAASGAWTLYLPTLLSSSESSVSFSVVLTQQPEATRGAQPGFAVVEVSGDPIAVESRDLVLGALSVDRIHFGAGFEAEESGVRAALMERFDGKTLRVPGGMLTAVAEAGGGLDAGRPQLVYSAKPATVLHFKGRPDFAETSSAGVERAVNASIPVYFDLFERRYLAVDPVSGAWFKSFAPNGPYARTRSVPERVLLLERRGMADAGGRTIVVAPASAHVLWTDGEPRWEPTGADWDVAVNANLPLFKHRGEGRFAVVTPEGVLASEQLEGPWSPQGEDRLPEQAVLSPARAAAYLFPGGTGGNAALSARLPQTRVPQNVPDAPPPQVRYAGPVRFARDAGGGLRRVVNADAYVVSDGASWYAASNGVWFEARSPRGPWRALEDPPAGVAQLSAGDEIFPLKFVYPVRDRLREEELRVRLEERERERRLREEEWRWRRYRYDPWDDWYWRRGYNDPWIHHPWHPDWGYWNDPWRWPHRYPYPAHGGYWHRPGVSIGVSAHEWYEVDDRFSIGIGYGVWHGWD